MVHRITVSTDDKVPFMGSTVIEADSLNGDKQSPIIKSIYKGSPVLHLVLLGSIIKSIYKGSPVLHLVLLGCHSVQYLYQCEVGKE